MDHDIKNHWLVGYDTQNFGTLGPSVYRRCVDGTRIQCNVMQLAFHRRNHGVFLPTTVPDSIGAGITGRVSIECETLDQRLELRKHHLA